MSQTHVTILAADLVGYSRLTEADEEGTLERLKALRRDLIDPKIAEHHGRMVKTTGDGLLVEFASVVEACAARQRCAYARYQITPIRAELGAFPLPALLSAIDAGGGLAHAVGTMIIF
jgi:class 3 adenylate cyclase